MLMHIQYLKSRSIPLNVASGAIILQRITPCQETSNIYMGKSAIKNNTKTTN